MKILITGNTGFKGSWLSLILHNLGHEIYGLSLPPSKDSLYNAAQARKFLVKQKIVDIRDAKSTLKTIQKINPEILIHLAAQPLVLDSYLNPRKTFETNSIGTFNVLESIKKLPELRATLIITTDKVYRNMEIATGYKETDRLGGDDPYSASKAMADILTQSWRESFGATPISIARAGNVIGGGDFSQDRIIPDIMQSIFTDRELVIRSQESVRPWQHVLDCLAGYINLIDYMLETGKSDDFNFAPDPESFRTVKDLLEEIEILVGSKLPLRYEKPKFRETNVLTLQADKAKQILGFKNRLNFEKTVNLTYDWFVNYYKKENMNSVTKKQIIEYFNLINFKFI